jgi:ParB-like chromosome segregation protein Spo0J
MAVANPSALAVELIPLDQIHAQRNITEALPDIPQLAESIRRHGILTAILVERRPGGRTARGQGRRRRFST